MRFQHITPWIAEEDLDIDCWTPDVSKHWKRIMESDFSSEAARQVEEIFEQVRHREYPTLPSRKSCLFLFDLGLDPDKYAASMSFIKVQEELSLVHIEANGEDSVIVRVDRSLLTCRLNTNGELTASDDEIVADARKYWVGKTQCDYDTEVLLSGRFKYAQIIRKATRPIKNGRHRK